MITIETWNFMPQRGIIAKIHSSPDGGPFMLFDAIDRRILAILQEAAETPITEIAERVGLSTSPCWRRIKRMEEAGLIVRRVVLIDREKANVGMSVFVTIRAPSHSVEWSEAFGRVVRDIPEIIAAHRLAGEADYLLHVVVPSIRDYDQVYKRMISKLEFRDVSSLVSMEEMKSTTALPLDYL